MQSRRETEGPHNRPSTVGQGPGGLETSTQREAARRLLTKSRAQLGRRPERIWQRERAWRRFSLFQLKKGKKPLDPRKYWGLAQRPRNQSVSGGSQKARAEFETQLGVRGKARVTGQTCSQAKCTEIGSQEARDMVQGTTGQPKRKRSLQAGLEARL